MQKKWDGHTKKIHAHCAQRRLYFKFAGMQSDKKKQSETDRTNFCRA